MFALSFMIIFLGVGLAIDTGRAMHVGNKIANALDAAALAAAKGMREQGLSDDEVRQLAGAYFEENMKGHVSSYATLGTLSVQIDRRTSTVTVGTDADVPTIFGRLAGLNTLSFPKTAAATYNIRDIEVGLALDVTGSMSGSKIEDLKGAARDLVDILIPDQRTSSRKVRIGLAPYAATVNAGPYARIATGNRSVDGCVLERRTGNLDGDLSPLNGGLFGVRGDGNSRGNGQYSCPRAEIQPITDDKTVLKASIDSFRTGGFTGGHLGAAWAWYLISPNWASVWPSESTPVAYRDERTIKALILMTDGEFNTSYSAGVGGPAQVSESFRRADGVCRNAKGEQVIIYTIGFKLRDASAINALRTCATSIGHFFLAENGEELRAAFRTIATNLANLRLAN
ncbi:MAG: hypothetical protein KDJ41_04900 [Hyphomicrobiaceae bacterium]|nr:hypothetical protein [Hyphomicrobiaceae bacterium]